MTFFTGAWGRARNGILIVCMVMLVTLLLSACGGDPQTQQQANKSKADLDNLISHAQSIGVPDAMLKPIIQQEDQLSNTNAPITVFSGQPATDYSSNLTQRYQFLAVQVHGLEFQTTQQLIIRPHWIFRPWRMPWQSDGRKTLLKLKSLQINLLKTKTSSPGPNILKITCKSVIMPSVLRWHYS